MEARTHREGDTVLPADLQPQLMLLLNVCKDTTWLNSGHCIRGLIHQEPRCCRASVFTGAKSCSEEATSADVIALCIPERLIPVPTQLYADALCCQMQETNADLGEMSTLADSVNTTLTAGNGLLCYNFYMKD